MLSGVKNTVIMVLGFLVLAVMVGCSGSPSETDIDATVEARVETTALSTPTVIPLPTTTAPAPSPTSTSTPVSPTLISTTTTTPTPTPTPTLTKKIWSSFEEIEATFNIYTLSNKAKESGSLPSGVSAFTYDVEGKNYNVTIYLHDDDANPEFTNDEMRTFYIAFSPYKNDYRGVVVSNLVIIPTSKDFFAIPFANSLNEKSFNELIADLKGGVVP